MPRSITVPQATYPPGTYGPYSIQGGFSAASADYVEAVLTVVGWPTASPLFVLRLAWDDGPPAEFTVPWVSGQTDKYGTPIAEARFRFGIPRTAAGKVAVSKASMSADVFAAMTTAITVRAESAP